MEEGYKGRSLGVKAEKGQVGYYPHNFYLSYDLGQAFHDPTRDPGQTNLTMPNHTLPLLIYVFSKTYGPTP